MEGMAKDKIMKRSFFALWYYGTGLVGLLHLWRDRLSYEIRVWNTTRLLVTLVSPWKRDVRSKSWLGFSLSKSFDRFASNIISRFMGMVVRVVTIVAGLVVFLFVLLAGGFILALYLVAPTAFIFGLVVIVSGAAWGNAVVALSFCMMTSAFIAYELRVKTEEYSTAFETAIHRLWFSRVLGRLGLVRTDVSEQVLKNEAGFLAWLKDKHKIEEPLYRQALLLESSFAMMDALKKRSWSHENLAKVAPIGKGWTYAYTPHLDRYATDLSDADWSEYGRLELVGRKEELELLTIILRRPNESSAFIIGDPGIGKKVIVHHLARQVRENEFAGDVLDGLRMMMFDAGRAVGDALHAGEDPEAFIRPLLIEATNAGNVVLIVDNLDQYFSESTSSSHPNLAPLFAEFLPYPSFRVIGTASTGRYHSLARDDEMTLKFFEAVYLREPTRDETLVIMAQHFAALERLRVGFTLAGLKRIITASERYSWGTPFPERALDLAQQVLGFWEAHPDSSFITVETVDAFLSLKTGMPMGKIDDTEREKLLHLEDVLHTRVIGQEEAVNQLAEALRKTRAGFGSSKRPVGSFLFLGPTGVGKTETVKALAAVYFNDETKMVRLDMSEFQTPEAVDRLIGSESLGQQGYLTNLVKDHPFGILLLDEVEKANPRALDLFLQILDEGYVTDGFGEKINFRNMIIVATSNAGAPIIKQGIDNGTPNDVLRKTVMDFIIANNVFRPELLNRFDGVIFFRPLVGEELLSVVNLQLSGLADRLKKEKNITVSFGTHVAGEVVARGYEPEFGARSLNRFIADAVEDVLARKIIAGDVEPGGAVVIESLDK